MMKATFVLWSRCQKNTGKGLELLDLIQEGSLGGRAVEKFDPTRGYKFPMPAGGSARA